MRALSSFILEVGIEAESCSARLALRILVSMSAIGSVSTFSSYQLDFVMPGTAPWGAGPRWARPRGRVRQPGTRALVAELAQADPAEAELAIDRARASAAVAARVGPHLVLRL